MLSIGNRTKRKKVALCLFLAFIICFSTINTRINVKSDTVMWLNLTLKTSVGGWGVSPDIALYIADYLEDIGINVKVIVEPWDSNFSNNFPFTHDFDLALVSTTGVGETPDWRPYYKEGFSLDLIGYDFNMFGLKYDIPYCNLNEKMLDEGIEIMDFPERQQHYYAWQELIMDQIIPLFPLFYNPSYEATWANTLGYESRWGIVDCLPYMSFNSLHEGQVSMDQLNIESSWQDLNPIYRPVLQLDYDNTRILDLIHEPMIQWSPEQIPIKTGLIHDWIKIDDCHYKFFLRDNVYWNPSYNVTDRNDGSAPLDTIPTGELMIGLKDGEYSDGSNQQVMAKDVVFTLLTIGSPIASFVPDYMQTISDIYVDPSDPLAFHLHIDGDPETSKLEPFADIWTRLMERVIPEFFLNSTDPTESYSLGGVKTVGLYPGIYFTPQWQSYSTSAFGCGKYMLDYNVFNSKSVFQRSPYWFGVGAIDGTEDMTPFVQTINAHVFLDPSVELAEFNSGRLDWTNLDQFPIDRRIMEDDSRFNVTTAPHPNFSYMVFNLRRPVIGGAWNYALKDGYTLSCYIRKAICYAIDREQMNEEIFNGERIIAHSVIYPYTEYYYYDDIIKYERNLETANDWLYVKEQFPDITVNIKNLEKVGKDLIVEASFDDSFDITSSTLKYRVNDGDWINKTMIESSDNFFKFDIGKEYDLEDLIELSVELETSEGNTFNSQMYSFIVGTEPVETYSKATISIVSLIMFVLVIRRIKKRSRN